VALNKRSDLVGTHATFGASNYHWIRYTDDKLIDVFNQRMAIQRGTDRHALASELIRLNVKLPDTRQTLNMYVNDGIGYGMKTEFLIVPLPYSKLFYGTADAIKFQNNLLRIHDFKDGMIEASMDQLKIYMAFFCLEMELTPFEIDAELRIYQNDAIKMVSTQMKSDPDFYLDPDEIMHFMQKVVHFDRLLQERIRMGAS